MTLSRSAYSSAMEYRNTVSGRPTITTSTNQSRLVIGSPDPMEVSGQVTPAPSIRKVLNSPQPPGSGECPFFHCRWLVTERIGANLFAPFARLACRGIANVGANDTAGLVFYCRRGQKDRITGNDQVVCQEHWVASPFHQ